MRKLIFIASATVMMVLSGNIVANAQGKYGADSAECIKYLSYYTEYYKQKNYDQALPSWRKAYKLCPPQARHGLFTDGSVLIRREIAANKGDAARVKSLIDTLMTLHDTRAKYYPKYAVTALNNKGQDICNYLASDNGVVYEGLNYVINQNAEQTKPSLLVQNLNSAIELYKLGKIDAEQVINIYQRNVAYADKAPAKDAAEAEQNAKVKSDLESLFITSKVASCDNLIALFTPRYEANPNDAELASNIVKMMSSTEGCINNDLYLKAATTVHRLQPTGQSAYFLYKLNAAKGNSSEAIGFLKEALNSSDLSNSDAAAYNYEYAMYCIKNGRNGEAYSAAQKAANLDPSYQGKAYYVMGSVWGSTSCGGDEISRRAPYWVACDYMQRAKAADPSLTSECNSMIGRYSAYFPKTADAFMYDLQNGQSYTVSCGGMTATTTVRTQK